MNHLLQDEIALIKEASKHKYATPYGCLYAPFDEEAVARCRALTDKFASYKPTLIVLVGIGGSNMGVLAVVEALKGIFYTQATPRFYGADTIDNDATSSLLHQIEQELVAGGIPVVCIVTKSGSTTETLINAALVYDCLKKYKPHDYHKYIVVITDEDSSLAEVAVQNNFELLTIPALIGGRYSVFSPVGLFPLMLLGIDVDSFLAGARATFKRSISDDEKNNYAAQRALTLYNAYNEGLVIHDIFLFSPALTFLGSWYKQLIGESLGKKYSRTGALVAVGITPTVSVGTVDLHSVVQLYLAGPRIRSTTFLSFSNEPVSLDIPSNPFSMLLPSLPGATVTQIKESIYTGVLKAYEQEQRPFMDISLTYQSSESLGAFMMLCMVETIFLARLLSINAFDQPAVELYKQEARKASHAADKTKTSVQL